MLDAIGDQARYIGPIGAGSVAKLVHNCAGAAGEIAMAEVFTMGVKAGVDPLRCGSRSARARWPRADFRPAGDHFLTGTYDPPDFALRLGTRTSRWRQWAASSACRCG